MIFNIVCKLKITFFESTYQLIDPLDKMMGGHVLNLTFNAIYNECKNIKKFGKEVNCDEGGHNYAGVNIAGKSWKNFYRKNNAFLYFNSIDE